MASYMEKGPELLRGAYWGDILDQPRALRNTVAALHSLRLDPGTRAAMRAPGAHVVLTGMGSSLHALYPLHLDLLEAGVDSAWTETAELIHAQSALLKRATVLVAVSQSGGSAELVRLGEFRRPECRCLVVSNTPGSALVRMADEAILTAAGPEATVACKTYLATLAALTWLSRMCLAAPGDSERCLDEIEAAAGRIEATQAGMEARVLALAREVDGASAVFLAGRGRSLSAVWSGALIAKEAAGVPVEGMSCPALRHGPLEMCGPGTACVIFAGAESTRALNSRLADDLRSAGARVGWVGTESESGPWRIPEGASDTEPIREALATQWLSLGLAAREGREAGRFQRATKVTSTE